jgi:hypothetical protein
MQMIVTPKLNGREVRDTEIDCPLCKSLGRKSVGGNTAKLAELVAPANDAERGLFCLTPHRSTH